MSTYAAIYVVGALMTLVFCIAQWDILGGDRLWARLALLFWLWPGLLALWLLGIFIELVKDAR